MLLSNMDIINSIIIGCNPNLSYVGCKETIEHITPFSIYLQLSACAYEYGLYFPFFLFN